MLLRTAFVCLLACSLVYAAPKSKKSQPKATTVGDEERIAALYIKDSTANGQLRFLNGALAGSTSGLGSAGTGNAATINQLITQKQNMLEQLRPSTGASNIYPPIVVTLNGGTGGTGGTTTTTTGTATGTGTITTGTGTNAINGSPVPQLLPQIVAQAVAGNSGVRRRRPANRRRVSPQRTGANVNRRKVANTNRRRGGNRNKQVYVIRPGRS